MKIYIGCDVGTSSTKAVAVDENGKVLAEGSKKYTFIQKHNNWAEQEPDVWLNIINLRKKWKGICSQVPFIVLKYRQGCI